MNTENLKNITSYRDLQRVKQNLKDKIADQEMQFKDNQLFNYASLLFSGKSIKKPLLDSISSLNFKDILYGPIGNILNTFLMTNKLTRKYFITFSLLKEMVPFTIQKLSEVLQTKK